MLADVVQVIEKAQLSIMTLSVVLFWLYKIDLSGVYKGLHERKSKQLDLLIKSLDNHHLSDNTKFAIKENVEAQLFYQSHGIRADKPYREALININKKYPNQARWFFLRRAYPFMSLGESGRVELKVGKKDVWINNIVTWFSMGVVLLGFISLLLFLFATVFKYLPAQLGFTMAGFGFIMIFMGMYFHWTTWGRHAAIKLSKLEI